jgi:hypothetical protein
VVPRDFGPPPRPEPEGRKAILEEVGWLQEQRSGRPPFVQWWIDKRIEELLEKMSKLRKQEE